MRRAHVTGSLLSIVIFFTLFILLSCRKKETSQPVLLPPADSTQTSQADTSSDSLSSYKTYLALGDSYTIGQSLDSSQRYPAQMVASLRSQNIRVAPIRYIAATGWTTLDLKSAIASQNPKGPFDIVTLLIGVNDQYQTNDTLNYRARFTDLLNTAILLSGNRKNHVFVLSIPDYGVTPFAGGRPGVSEQIDLFNTINKSVTDSYSISYTNVTDISRADAGDNTMLAGDGLHPSGKQYAQWTQVLEPKIYEVLK